MPRYACFALLASALLAPTPAAAVPLCQYVGTTGTLVGEQVLVNTCLPYGGQVRCTVLAPGTAVLGLVVVSCRPGV